VGAKRCKKGVIVRRSGCRGRVCGGGDGWRYCGAAGGDGCELKRGQYVFRRDSFAREVPTHSFLRGCKLPEHEM